MLPLLLLLLRVQLSTSAASYVWTRHRKKITDPISFLLSSQPPDQVRLVCEGEEQPEEEREESEREEERERKEDEDTQAAKMGHRARKNLRGTTKKKKEKDAKAKKRTYC